MFTKHHIVIVGAGGIGRAVGLILAEKNEFPVQLYIGDANGAAAEDAAQWIIEGCGQSNVVTPYKIEKTG